MMLKALSPSQVVFLQGGSFGLKKGSFSLADGSRVDQRSLAEKMVLAAILGAVDQALFTLAIGHDSQRFGARATDIVLAQAGTALGRAAELWSATTLEAHLARQLVQNIDQPAYNHIQRMAGRLIPTAVSNPWLDLALVVQKGLIAAGVIDMEVGRGRLPLVKEHRSRFSALEWEAAAATAVPAVLSLLAEPVLADPKLARLLVKAVDQGVAPRRASSEGGREDY